MVYVHPYYSSTQAVLQNSDASFASLNVSGVATINDLQVQTETVNGDLTVQGLITVINIQVNGHIILNLSINPIS